MVDRIDKPLKPDSYRIEQTTEPKRDKPQGDRNQHENSEFQQKQGETYEKKFASKSSRSKTFRIPTDKISHLIFRKAIPYHGAATCEVILHWKDGRVTENASFLLKNWQDFLRLKNLKLGEKVAESFWKLEKKFLEITVRQQGATSGATNLREIQKLEQNEATHVATDSRSKKESVLKMLGIINSKGEENQGAYWIYGAGILFVVTVMAILMNS